MGGIEAELRALADGGYRDFQAGLVPGVDPGRILGVRIPVLRRYARALAREREVEALRFLDAPAHALYDEMNLHALLIGLMSRTPGEAFGRLDAFLPHVDNWATCDLIRVPALGDDLPATLGRIRSWTAARPEYAVRFGVVQLMVLFLGEAFEPSQVGIVTGIYRPEYYINMARAWYLAEALARRPGTVLPLLEDRTGALDAWTRARAIRKALESRRVPPALKERLRAGARP